MKISVVIHTYNSEKFLEKVLESVKEFDEIVICDMYSTDETLNIASKYNCKIVYHEYTGGIPEPARNFAISNASNDWVLVIDSDEVVTRQLREYLYNFIKKNKDINGIRVSRKNFFLGRFMHASYPDYILRFFRKSVTYWPPTVHTGPQVKGKISDLPRKKKELALIHIVNSSVHTRIAKLNTYTDNEVIRRNNQKYGFWSIIIDPFGRFMHYYIFKGGFRDGKAGLIFALHGAFYKYATISKIIESRVSEDKFDDDFKNNI